MELNIAQRFLFLLCCSNFASMSQTARKIFSARQHICSARHMPSLVSLSVCLSVTRVDQSKTVEVKIKIMQFTTSSPIPLFFAL